MAQNFDRAQYFKGLEIAVGKLEEAQRLGVQLAEQPVKRLLFVACGAPNRIMGL